MICLKVKKYTLQWNSIRRNRLSEPKWILWDGFLALETTEKKIKIDKSVGGPHAHTQFYFQVPSFSFAKDGLAFSFKVPNNWCIGPCLGTQVSWTWWWNQIGVRAPSLLQRTLAHFQVTPPNPSLSWVQVHFVLLASDQDPIFLILLWGGIININISRCLSYLAICIGSFR